MIPSFQMQIFIETGFEQFHKKVKKQKNDNVKNNLKNWITLTTSNNSKMLDITSAHTPMTNYSQRFLRSVFVLSFIFHKNRQIPSAVLY